MSLSIENEYGVIDINSNIICYIAGKSAVECDGVVGMATKNMKDGLVRLLKGENVSHGVRVICDDDDVYVDLHIIVEYGANISEVANKVIHAVKYAVEQYIGIDIERVNVFVEGIKAI